MLSGEHYDLLVAMHQFTLTTTIPPPLEEAEPDIAFKEGSELNSCNDVNSPGLDGQNIASSESNLSNEHSKSGSVRSSVGALSGEQHCDERNYYYITSDMNRRPANLRKSNGNTVHQTQKYPKKPTANKYSNTQINLDCLLCDKKLQVMRSLLEHSRSTAHSDKLLDCANDRSLGDVYQCLDCSKKFFGAKEAENHAKNCVTALAFESF